MNTYQKMDSSRTMALLERAAEYLWTPDLLVHVCGKQILPALPYAAMFAPDTTATAWSGVLQDPDVDAAELAAALPSLNYQCVQTLASLPPLLDTHLLCNQRPIRTEVKLEIDRLLAKAQRSSSATQYAVLMEKIRELSYLRHPVEGVPDHWCAHRVLLPSPYLAERLVLPLALNIVFGVMPFVLHKKGVLSVLGPHTAVQQYIDMLKFIDGYGQGLVAQLPKQPTAQSTQSLRASWLYHFTANCATHLMEHVVSIRGHFPHHGKNVLSLQPKDIPNVRLQLSSAAQRPICRAHAEYFGIECAHLILDQLHSSDTASVLYVSDVYQAA